MLDPLHHFGGGAGEMEHGENSGPSFLKAEVKLVTKKFSKSTNRKVIDRLKFARN